MQYGQINYGLFLKNLIKKMNILHLTVNKWAFDKIASGVKKEEYREFKTYWTNRLMHPNYLKENWALLPEFIHPKKEWTHIKFTNGYGSDKPSVLIEFKGLRMATINPTWCPPGFIENDKKYFGLMLGEIVE